MFRVNDFPKRLRGVTLALTVTAASAVAMHGVVANAAGQASAPTLDGRPPLAIAHRGASGYRPDETLEAFQLAIDEGADVIEFDLISTKDGVLIARHDPELAVSTDIATRPEFAGRRRVDWLVDGAKQTGWFAHDSTLAEIKTLRVTVTDPERPQQNNGKFRIVTLQEIIDFAKAQSAKPGRSIAIYPETKNPQLPSRPRASARRHVDRGARRRRLEQSVGPGLLVQSFEPGSLKEMRARGLRCRMVQLIDGDDIDLKAGKITYAMPLDRPYDWAQAGDSRLFAAMVTPAGLVEIKTYADGIGPWKPYIVPVKGRLDAAGRLVDVNGDGKIDLRDASTHAATTLVADAHKAVHARQGGDRRAGRRRRADGWGGRGGLAERRVRCVRSLW